MPEGGAPAGHTAGSDELFKITVNTNQVVVPVMVKDDSGRLVNGLLSRDFSVFEDGKKQNLNFFTTDPFALSAAVLFDTGMPDVAMQKVIQTFSALQGAFSEFDEVSLYTYSTSVSRVTDFAAVGRRLQAALDSLKMVTGRNNGPPVTSGPMGPQGPMVNGRPIEGGAPRVTNPPRESHVLNDAIVAAALELRKRDRTRRKVIFIVSDGREYGSNASYSDTLKVLLSSGVQVYGVALKHQRFLDTAPCRSCTCPSRARDSATTTSCPSMPVPPAARFSPDFPAMPSRRRMPAPWATPATSTLWDI